MSNKSKKPKYYTKQQAAEIMGVTWITIHRWTLSGRLKVVEVAGLPRIPASELEPKEVKSCQK